MKKSAFKSIAEFKEFVYSPGEGHYFCFCEPHRNLMQRQQDISEEIVNVGEVCDYPRCRQKATYVFFANLYTALKRNL